MMGAIVGMIILTWFITVIAILLGERYVTKNPDEIFSKWWRKHVIKNGDSDDNDDTWMYM